MERPDLARAVASAHEKAMDALERITGDSAFARTVRAELTSFSIFLEATLERAKDGQIQLTDEAEVLDRRQRLRDVAARGGAEGLSAVKPVLDAFAFFLAGTIKREG